MTVSLQDRLLNGASASLLRDELVRARATLNRVSAVLCDNFPDDDPAAHWRAADIDPARMAEVARLIEEERL